MIFIGVDDSIIIEIVQDKIQDLSYPINFHGFEKSSHDSENQNFLDFCHLVVDAYHHDARTRRKMFLYMHKIHVSASLFWFPQS